MAAAMTDSLRYKSYMIDMNSGSYRMKETKQWLKESAKKQTCQFPFLSYSAGLLFNDFFVHI